MTSPPTRPSDIAICMLLTVAACVGWAPAVAGHGAVVPRIVVHLDQLEHRFLSENETKTSAFSVDYSFEVGGALIDPVEITIVFARLPAQVHAVAVPDRFVVEPELGRSSWSFFGNVTTNALALMPAGDVHQVLLFANATESGTVEEGYGSAPLRVEMGPVPRLAVAPATVEGVVGVAWSGANLSITNVGNVAVKVSVSPEGKVPTWLKLRLPESAEFPAAPDSNSTTTLPLAWIADNSTLTHGGFEEARFSLQIWATPTLDERGKGAFAVVPVRIVRGTDGGAPESRDGNHGLAALSPIAGSLGWVITAATIACIHRRPAVRPPTR